MVYTSADIIDGLKWGHLTSPQEFRGVHYFLMRLTGLGIAVRVDELTYRPAAIWRKDDILRECVGVPVFLGHTASQHASDAEYRHRILGSTVDAFVIPALTLEDGKTAASSIWGVVRIETKEDAEVLKSGEFSTSPGMITRKGEKVKMSGGDEVQLETGLIFFDHLAVVKSGVWDARNPNNTGILVGKKIKRGKINA